ncbi:armadillo-type protein [Trichoderma sp. SZMC 28011]
MAQQTRGVVLTQVNVNDTRDGRPDVDIIAVHGLDTRSPDTWTWRSKDRNKPDVNWLVDRDMLPHRMKRVRIFTCNWPADLFQDSNSIPWTVGEFARRLLAGIHTIRLPLAKDGRDRDRPIVFIASCLGGIILMEALIMANNPQSDYISIRKATRGIIFLATPFRGTAFKDIASWADPLLKTWASLGNRSVTQLLESVKGSNFFLEELVRSFTRLCQDTSDPCKVHTFYETRGTVLPGKFLPSYFLTFFDQSKPLVNSASATLDIDSNPLPLERRHVMMNKFSGPDDLDYITVVGRLEALLQVVRDRPPRQADIWIHHKHYTADRLQIERLSGDRLPMEQCYINLAIVARPGEKAYKPTSAQSFPFSLFARQKAEAADDVSERKSRVDLSTLFNAREDEDGGVINPRRVFIRGSAGVGKTTLCKKIVHEFYRGTWSDWNKIFDRILWVPLRNLKLKERTRPGYNYECLFSDEYFSLPESKPELAQELSKALVADNSRTLFLLDGLDEVSQYLRGEDAMSLFLEDLLKQANVIITSRPSINFQSKIDLELETIGFDPKQVKEYLYADPDTKPKVNEIETFLRDHWLLQSLVRIPIQLDALCYAWNDISAGVSLDTMTDIYHAIEQRLWRKDVVRLERISGRIQSPLPTEINNRIKSEAEILQFLAFSGMYCDVIYFTAAHRDKIVQVFSSVGLLLDETLGRLSFLRTSDSSSKMKDRSYHFLHLTFQEYFAAKYFVQSWTNREDLCILELDNHQKRANVIRVDPNSFLRERKYDARFDIFWRFVAGLLHTEYDEDQLCRFFLTIEDQPRDLLGPVHQRLTMHCLSEVVPSDEMRFFAPLRKELEDQLSRWLEFECNFRKTSRLASEIEFPERSLNSVLLRASEDVKIKIIKSLDKRSKLPQGTIELITDWLKGNPSRLLTSTTLTMLWSHNYLPPQSLEVVVKWVYDDNYEIARKAATLLDIQRTVPEYIYEDIIAHIENQQRSAYRELLFTAIKYKLPRNILETLAAQLEDQDPLVRRKALAKLGGLLPEDIQKAVAAQLKDQDPEIRLFALRALRSPKSPPDDIQVAIAAHLQDQDKNIQNEACRILKHLPVYSKNCPQAIATWLVTQDEDIKKVRSLHSHKRLALSDAVAAHLENENPDHQFTAMQLLRAEDELTDDTLDAVAAQLQNPDEDIKDIAIPILSRYTYTFPEQSTIPRDLFKVASEQLESQDNDVKIQAIRTLSVLRCQQGIPGEILYKLAMKCKDEDKDVREAILRLFPQYLVPDDILDFIVSQFKDQDPDIRYYTLFALTDHPGLSTYILNQIAEQLEDQDYHVRSMAASTLGNQSELSHELLKALALRLEDKDVIVRSSATEALCHRSLPEDIIEAIAGRLTDKSREVQRMALRALQAQLTLPARILEAVTQKINFEDDYVIREAVRVPGIHSALLPENAVQAITAWLEHKDEDFKQIMLEALRKQPNLPTTILQKAASYRGLLARSFEAHVSCYVMDGISYIDMPGDLGKVRLEGQLNGFMDAVAETQRRVGIPPQLEHVHR